MAGDFNDLPESRTLRAFYQAGFEHLEEPGPSWNAREPSVDIDHILVRSGRGLRFDPEAQWVRAQVCTGRIGRVVKTKGYGVHHAWGRTYKDIFQRYKAMKGFDPSLRQLFPTPVRVSSDEVAPMRHRSESSLNGLFIQQSPAMSRGGTQS